MLGKRTRLESRVRNRKSATRPIFAPNTEDLPERSGEWGESREKYRHLSGTYIYFVHGSRALTARNGRLKILSEIPESSFSLREKVAGEIAKTGGAPI